jgi:hypothetical protein
MESLANGLYTVVNGVYGLVDAALSPAAVMVGLVAAALTWLSLIELDELNRQGRKPEIGMGQ